MSNIKLNLGCGAVSKEGFVNIDLEGPEGIFVHDLRTGLPDAFPKVKMIFSSHFLEHLSNADAMTLLRDCYTKLVPGGRIRLVMPDFYATFKAYVNRDESYFDLINLTALGFPIPEQCFINRLEYSVYQFGEHVSLWDDEKTINMLKCAGFENPKVVKWNDGKDGTDPLRQKYSTVVEAVK